MHKGRNLQTTALMGLMLLTIMAALGHAQVLAPERFPMGPDIGAVAFITGLLGLVSSFGPGPRA
jgi:hypothetical protein